MNKGLALLVLTLWAAPSIAQEQSVPLTLAEADCRGDRRGGGGSSRSSSGGRGRNMP